MRDVQLIRRHLLRLCLVALTMSVTTAASAQDSPAQDPAAPPPQAACSGSARSSTSGRPDPGLPGLVGGSVITREQTWTFDKTSLDQAVNMVPGVSSTFDANGRRNESDIFVRGFGRWQVPLLIDGVRIYLPADNRLDFGRFLTADIAAIQIQKGYASVIDGPGAMGGVINLVTVKPTKTIRGRGRHLRRRPGRLPGIERLRDGRQPPATLLPAGQRRLCRS